MSMTGLPPGPRSPAAVQTARWLTAPIPLMEECRRRFGDAFSLRFLGFERPMVLLSDPDAIRALYSAPEHGLPPGRTAALRPIMGERSILLLEGAEHLERRRLMLPPFHGERMRGYEDDDRADHGAPRSTAGRAGGPFALHPRMRAITFEVILRGRVRRHRPPARGAAARAAAAAARRDVLARAELPACCSRAGSGRRDPLARLRGAGRRDRRRCCSRTSRRAAGVARGGEDVLSLLLAARFEDGSAMSDRELRDQLVTLLLAGHETTATALAWTFDLLTHSPARCAA